MRDIWVVTNTQREFNLFLSVMGNAWEYERAHGMIRFLWDAEQLKGMKPCRVVLFGSYFKRKDWDKVEAAILIGGHRKLLIR